MTELIGSTPEYASAKLSEMGFRVKLSALTCGKDCPEADSRIVVALHEKNGEVLLYVGDVKRNV